jgi:hypothetical protein
MKHYLPTVLLLTLSLTLLSLLPAYAGTTEEGNEQLLKKCIAFESDQKVSFSNDADWMAFTYYYINNYQLNDCQLLYHTSGNHTITIADSDRYDRDQVIQNILNTFGTIPGNTTAEIINNACRMTASTIHYNKSYSRASVEQALSDCQGVCWQRAKICSILLQEQNIPCDIVYGYVGSNIKSHKVTHTWLRCKDGNRTIYADLKKGILSSAEYASNYDEITLNDWIQMQQEAS